jgi:hypothetical protein
MSDLAEFYLGSLSSVAELELFEISHPDMTQTYRFCPQAKDGVTVDLSPGELDVPFIYYPAEASVSGARDDLDAEVSLQLGDVGTLMPDEVDAIEEAGGMLTKPTLRFWVFRSDDLTAPRFGPLTLEIPTLASEEMGSSIEARAPRLNANRTGEIYSLGRFPMLRGWVT